MMIDRAGVLFDAPRIGASILKALVSEYFLGKDKGVLELARFQPSGKELHLFLDRPFFSNESLHGSYGVQRGGMVPIEASANGLEGFACIASR